MHFLQCEQSWRAECGTHSPDTLNRGPWTHREKQRKNRISLLALLPSYLFKVNRDDAEMWLASAMMCKRPQRWIRIHTRNSFYSMATVRYQSGILQMCTQCHPYTNNGYTIRMRAPCGFENVKLSRPIWESSKRLTFILSMHLCVFPSLFLCF